MRIVAQRIVFFANQILDFNRDAFWDANDDCVGGDVTKPLAISGKDADRSAQKVKRREHVGATKEIADDDLAKLEAQAVHVHDAKAKEAFARSLAVPGPFKIHSVAD